MVYIIQAKMQFQKKLLRNLSIKISCELLKHSRLPHPVEIFFPLGTPRWKSEISYFTGENFFQQKLTGENQNIAFFTGVRK